MSQFLQKPEDVKLNYDDAPRRASLTTHEAVSIVEESGKSREALNQIFRDYFREGSASLNIDTYGRTIEVFKENGEPRIEYVAKPSQIAAETLDIHERRMLGHGHNLSPQEADRVVAERLVDRNGPQFVYEGIVGRETNRGTMSRQEIVDYAEQVTREAYATRRLEMLGPELNPATQENHFGLQRVNDRIIEEASRGSLARATDSWSGLAFAAREAGIESPTNFSFVEKNNEILTYKRETGEVLHFRDHNAYAHRAVPGEGPVYNISYYADSSGTTKISPAEALLKVAPAELEVKQQELGRGWY